VAHCRHAVHSTARSTSGKHKWRVRSVGLVSRILPPIAMSQFFLCGYFPRLCSLNTLYSPTQHSACINPLSQLVPQPPFPDPLIKLLFPSRPHVSPILLSHPACRYYFPQLTPDELLVFKTYDSALHPFTPALHAAFDDPTCPTGEPARVSCEARVLVVITTVPARL
jgi:hypothetical protein